MQPVCSAVLQCSLIRIDVRGAAKRQLRGFPHRRRNFSPTYDIDTTASTATTASSTSSRHSADTPSRHRRFDARGSNFPPLHRPLQLRSYARRRHRTLHSPHQRDDDHTRQRRPGKGDLGIEETARFFCSTSSKLRHRWRRRTELRRHPRNHDTTSDTTRAIKVKRAGFRRLRMTAASLCLQLECSRESDIQLPVFASTSSSLPRRANQHTHPAYRSRNQLQTGPSSCRQQVMTVIATSMRGRIATPRAKSLPPRRTTDDTARSSLSMYTR